MIPDNFGSELQPPVVFSEHFLNEDGSLNLDRVILAIEFHQQMVNHLKSLMGVTDQPLRPVAINIRFTWEQTLDGQVHVIRPEDFDDPRVYDPLVLRNRIHSAYQRLRKKTGAKWYPELDFVELSTGKWYFNLRAVLRNSPQTGS